MADFVIFERYEADPETGKEVLVNVDAVRTVCFIQGNRLRLRYHDGNILDVLAAGTLGQVADLLNNRPDLDEPRDPAASEVCP